MASPSSSPCVIQYQVLYYKQTRKVHKSKGVSKSDGILFINTATGVVSLFEEKPSLSCSNDENNNSCSSSGKLLYTSSLNAEISKRSTSLEADETVQLGGFELDIVCKLDAASAEGTNRPLEPMTTKSTQRLRFPQKRPLGATMTTTQQSTKVIRKAISNPGYSLKAIGGGLQRRTVNTQELPANVSSLQSFSSNSQAECLDSLPPLHPRRRLPPAQPLTSISKIHSIKGSRVTEEKKESNSLSAFRSSRGVVGISFASTNPVPASITTRDQAAIDKSDDTDSDQEEAVALPSQLRNVSNIHRSQRRGMPPNTALPSSYGLSSYRVIRQPLGSLLNNKVKKTPAPQTSVRAGGGEIATTAATVMTTSPACCTSHAESSLSPLTKSPFPATATATATATTQSLLSHIPLPAKVARVLRPHQVTGVKFLYSALHDPKTPDGGEGQERMGRGAILADEPGLGKTLMTIAIISALHRQHRHKHFCVVCPSSLVTNWTREFDKWLGHEGQPKRVPLKKGDTSYNSSSMKSFLVSKIGLVVIMSYELFRIHSHQFSTDNSSQASPNQFALLVLDEGHRLKNKSGSLTLTALEQLPCDARLLLSATPIQNNLTELYTLANFCRPGVLGDLNEFRQRFERPILAAAAAAAIKGNNTKAVSCSAQRELDQITSTFILRRLQKDVLRTMLPPRTEVLLFCRPSPRQCGLYEEVVASISGATTASGSTDALSALTSLRKVCLHPLLHGDETINSNNTRRCDGSYDNATDQTTIVHLSGKLNVLKALLSCMRKAGDSSKVVVVSNFTSALNLVETLLLKPLDFSYVRLDGSTGIQDRQAIVDTFNRQDVFCFLLSSKAGGCGLNLIGANRLVLLDPSWNPADDIQAMGRIYRQGQTRATTIYRLFTSGTIEEVIYQRQCQKGNLAGIIDKKCAKFSREELNDCFTLKVGCDCDTKRKLGKLWHPYDGPDSLLDQGCSDVPLMEVAKHASDTLGFVHIVREEDEPSGRLPMSPQQSIYDSDAEEEYEFDSNFEEQSSHSNRPLF